MSARYLSGVVVCAIVMAACTKENTYYRCESCFVDQPSPGVCASSDQSPYDVRAKDEKEARTNARSVLCRHWEQSLTAEARVSLERNVGDAAVYCLGATNDRGGSSDMKWPITTTCTTIKLREPTEYFPVPIH